MPSCVECFAAWGRPVAAETGHYTAVRPSRHAEECESEDSPLHTGNGKRTGLKTRRYNGEAGDYDCGLVA